MIENWPEIRTWFEQACDRPPAERLTWLAAQPDLDARVRAEVERLLRADAGDEALEPPTWPQAPAWPLQNSGGAPPQLGQFRLLEPIGSGGMGTVYRAEQERPRRFVAVKVVHRELAGGRSGERFRAEVEALARLQHPRIAQVLEAGVEADGTARLAMELLAGARPLAAPPGGVRPWADAVRSVLAVADALQHAHQRGVIHRDLKPGNILIAPDGGVKVIDFGIARLLDADAAQRTRVGELLGTLAYMSPEQVEGRETDVRTDVYGLGVVLYELVGGQRPFDVDEQALTTACRMIVEQEPAALRQRIRSLPPELDWIVGRALQKRPADRYQSIADFAADLERLLQHQPVVAAPESTGYRLRKFVRRHRFGVAIGLALAVAFAATFTGTVVSLVQTQRAERAEREGRERAELANERATVALDFLLGVFQQVEPGNGGREIRMVDALARTSLDFRERLAATPSIAAALGRTIGLAHSALGDLEAAERHLRESLEHYEQLRSAQDPSRLQTAVDLVAVLLQRGSFDDADTLLADVEASLPDAVAPPMLRVATVLRRAELHRIRNQRERARDMLRELLDAPPPIGPEARQAWFAHNQLASVLHQLGDLDAAEGHYRLALREFERRGDLRHPEALTIVNNLAVLEASRGRFAAAEPLFEQLLQARREVLGEAHPHTIGTISNLAGVRSRLGRHREAAEAFRAVLAALGGRASDREPTVQTLLSNLATAEREAGNLDEALRVGYRVLAARRDALGESHPTTLMTLAMVAEAHRRAHELPVARERFDECARLAEAQEPPDLVNLYRGIFGRARCELEAGELSAAERSLRRCGELHASAERAAGDKGVLPSAQPLLDELQRALEQAGRAGGAEPSHGGR